MSHLSVAGEIGAEGLIPTTDSFGSAPADIVRCRDCGHMQLDRFPSEKQLGEAYADAASDDYVEEEAGQRATAVAILERIEARVERGAILDLGCWVGFLLAEAKARGWSATGVEPSEFAFTYAREQLGLDVRQGELLGTELPSASYDAAMLGDVIEHLVEPGAALDHIHGLLRPGGVLALALPDSGSRLARAMGARWWAVVPTHVQYFTRSSLTRLLREHDFEVLELSTAPKAFTVRYYLDRLSGYSPRISSGLVAAAIRAGIAERIWAPDFRDRMLVLARAV